MTKSLAHRLFGGMAMVVMLVLGTLAVAADGTHYVITNDDVPPKLLNGVSIYAIAPDGDLNFQKIISSAGLGIGGGFFGANRIRVLSTATEHCVYFSEAFDSVIVGLTLPDGSVGGMATGSPEDAGTSNGIGLALNSKYLYASFTDSNTIGTFLFGSGCDLTFVNDITVGGLQGGTIDAMAVHGNILIATYGDGSIESFDISGGTPIPNGDEQNSPAAISSNAATYPSSVDITSDGHFAIFGDTSTAAVVEVADISSGHLANLQVYQSFASISSSNVMLSPDETILYVVNTQGARLAAAFFDKKTGKLSPGCDSGFLRGWVENYSYLGGLTFATNTGTGGEVYIAEFGNPSSIAMVHVTSAGGKCSLREAANSPVSDNASPGLLSIASFPPRSF